MSCQFPDRLIISAVLRVPSFHMFCVQKSSSVKKLKLSDKCRGVEAESATRRKYSSKAQAPEICGYLSKILKVKVLSYILSLLPPLITTVSLSLTKPHAAAILSVYKELWRSIVPDLCRPSVDIPSQSCPQHPVLQLLRLDVSRQKVNAV